jgi:predicted lactoylglutathione lyase
MKRFHVNVSVNDLSESTRFYSKFFGSEPAVVKDDYVKWMLDDPRINFSISTGNLIKGINHIGIQTETMAELESIQARLSQAGEQTFDQPQAECCYAKSSKTWVRDPDDVAWETFVTHGKSTFYGEDRVPAAVRADGDAEVLACCSSSDDSCCSPA